MTNKFSIKKGSLNYAKGDVTKGRNYNKIGVLGYYYKDKPQIQEIDYGVFYETNKFYLDLKKWKLWQNKNQRNGKYLTFHYNFNSFTFGFEWGIYEKFSYFYPYIEYKSNLNYLYYQSITGKDMKTFCAVDKHLKTHHLVVSKYKGISTKYKKDITDFWWSMELSKIDNNIAFTPQFLYRLKRKDEWKSIEFYYYLSGWYQFNQKENDCYYSPKKYDSTYIELHPIYKKLELIGKVGYSFEGQTKLYSYGFNFSNEWLNFGCMRNFSYKTGFDTYWYEECELKAGVKW